MVLQKTVQLWENVFANGKREGKVAQILYPQFLHALFQTALIPFLLRALPWPLPLCTTGST